MEHWPQIASLCFSFTLPVTKVVSINRILRRFILQLALLTLFTVNGAKCSRNLWNFFLT